MPKTSKDEVIKNSEFTILKDQYEELLCKYEAATETISMLKKDVDFRDVTINELIAVTKPRDANQLEFEEYQIEVEALRKDINIISKQNSKLEEKLDSFSIENVEIDVTDTKSKFARPFLLEKSFRDHAQDATCSNSKMDSKD